MRRLTLLLTILCTTVCIGLATPAAAQTAAAPGASHTYAEVTFGPTFGQGAKPSGAFGFEGGMPYKSLHFFAEAGRMLNVGSDELTTSAGVITKFLGASGAATSTIKQPITYFAAGIRYNLPQHGRFNPYVSFALGAAHATKDVHFFVNNVDVTAQLLGTYGVQLGTDLAGDETKAYLEAGLGAHINLTSRLMGDVSYRYGHVFLVESGLNSNRVQFGVGVGF